MHTTQLDLPFLISYSLEPAEDSGRGLLVLHGYSDHARAARKRLLGTAPVPGFAVLAPNALFPAPVKVGEHYKEAYSWYFRDPHSGKQMIPPDFAAASLMKLIDRLGLASLRWTILGFSQGGFFAPFLVRHGLNAGTIIAVGAAYRPESYVGLRPVEVHGLHGDQDQDVPFDVAKSSFEALRSAGYGKEFRILAGVGHALNDEGRSLIRRILDEELKK